jgi:hypothetical protein
MQKARHHSSSGHNHTPQGINPKTQIANRKQIQKTNNQHSNKSSLNIAFLIIEICLDFVVCYLEVLSSGG